MLNLNKTSKIDTDRIWKRTLTKEKVWEYFRRWFLEIPIFFLLMVGAEYWLFDKFSAWNQFHQYRIPHPFWLGILLFGLVYGIFDGFLTGLIAAALLVYFIEIPGWNPFEWGIHAALPFSFILLGILSGVVHMLFLEKARDLVVENDNLKEQILDLDQLNLQMISTNLRLENRIVSRYDTFQTLFEAAKLLTSLRLTEILQHVPEILHNILGAKKCSLYLQNNEEQLEIRSYWGWSDEAEFIHRIENNHPIFSVLASHTHNSILKTEELQHFDIDAKFVVSLVSPERKLFGVLKIEEINYLDITGSHIQLLLLLSEWIMEAVDSSTRYATTESLTIVDLETGLLKENVIWNHLQKTVTSAIRNKYDIVVMFLHFQLPEQLEEEEFLPLLREVAVVLKEECRQEDELAKIGQGLQSKFFILLPFTDFEKARILLERVNPALDYYINRFKKENDLPMLFYYWEILSLLDGTLFLNDTINHKLQMID